MSSDYPPSPEENRPTVVHVTGHYVKGSEGWIHDQVSHLREHAPFVLTGQTQNLDTLDWVPPHYETFERSLIARLFDRLARAALGYRPTRRWHLKRHDARLLHAHFGPLGYKALDLADAFGIPLVTTFYGFDLSLLPQQSPEWRDRYQVLFDRGTHFLVEGPHMKEQLVELGCPASKVSVHHLGVNLDMLPYRPRRRENEQPLRVLAAGRFTEKKGFPHAIEAFARFLEQGGEGHFTIVGGLGDDDRDRAARDELRRVARRHGVEAQVILREFLPHDELIEAYHDHDVFLSPSIEACDGDNEGGAPVTIIEAAATGMPVVSTRHCDIPEAVKHEETGLLAEEGDTEALAQFLFNIYEHAESMEEMAKAARTHVEREYDAFKQGKKLDDIYRRIISGGRL